MIIHTILDAASVVRSRRSELNLSQAVLARRAGVSRKWVYEFEAGKPNAELGILLSVLTALNLTLRAEEALPNEQSDDADLDRLLDEYRR